MSGDSVTRSYRQVARAEASDALRARIVRAFADAMVSQWFDEITLDGVAAAARTTRQTVIRLFGGKDGLLAAAIEIFRADVDARWRQPAGTSPAMIAEATVENCEILGDAVMRMLALAPRHPELARVVAENRLRHRRNFAETLAPALASLPQAEAERVLCACLIATDTYTWALLRRDFGKGVAETKTIIARMLTAALRPAETHS
jgi:AcrR family transcriptional regulator